jgi:SAM-dependent methyltransferase
VRVITVIETADDADVVELQVRRALASSAAVLVICHPASDGTRERLVGLSREGLPIVVFDDPRSPAVDTARAVQFSRNARRFFDPDVLVWLGRRELHVPSARLLRDQLAELDRHPSPAPSGDEARRIHAELAHAESGIWSESLHVENLYVDHPPFRYLWDRFAPQSVLDSGCGLGAYLDAYRRWGAVETLGVDGFETAGHVLCAGAHRCHDLRQPLNLGRTFDLVVCTEVVEHIDAAYEATVLDTIARHARGLILFSAARPGQPGVGHVNCKPIEHWLNLWARDGWEPDVFDTLAVRSLSTYYWFRRNLLVLCRRASHRARVSTFTSADLASYEAEHVAWVAQPPAIHSHPLQSPLG